MKRTKLLLICFFTVAIFGSLLYFIYDPAKEDLFPDCVFHELTGLFCPGCGSQRAVHNLLHGNVLRAANYNLMLVTVSPFLLYHFTLLGYSQLRQNNKRIKTIFNNSRFSIGLTVALILFWILRNIPSSPFSWLAP